MNTNLFMSCIIALGMSVESLANKIGMHPVTLYRKLSGKSDFTRKEILSICYELKLDSEQMERIFFDEKLA